MMPFDAVHPTGKVLGQVRGFYVPDNTPDSQVAWLSRPVNRWQHNDMTYDWGTIVQRLLRRSPDGKRYDISGMYFEFDNSGSAVDPLPVIDRADDVAYYAGLTAPRDYLRVPISATSEDTTDADLYPNNNVAVFWAQTAGTTGVNGLTFSDGANSRIYGGALVAIRDMEDPSQDIILNRFYWAGAQQLEKLPSLQCSVKWPIAFL